MLKGLVLAAPLTAAVAQPGSCSEHHRWRVFRPEVGGCVPVVRHARILQQLPGSFTAVDLVLGKVAAWHRVGQGCVSPVVMSELTA